MSGPFQPWRVIGHPYMPGAFAIARVGPRSFVEFRLSAHSNNVARFGSRDDAQCHADNLNSPEAACPAPRS